MLDINFNPFPYLETERLMLRKITAEDLDDMFELRTDLEAMKYLGKPIPKKKEVVELINRIENNLQNNAGINWGMCLKNQSKVIGTISYHKINKDHYRAEIGYMLLHKHWFKGLMSEALSAILDDGFKNMNFNSIEALVDPKNEKSIRILEKFNFVKEAHFKENFFFEGRFIDTQVYSLLNPLNH